MFNYFIQGLILGFSYVAPIGTQNLYIINTALQKSRLKVLQTALITVFFDVTLAIACFFSIGYLIDRFYGLKLVILLVGSLIVVYIGYKLVTSSASVSNNFIEDASIWKVISTCFVVTWFNPQAVIDGSLLLGGFKASLPADMSIYFILGVCTASCTWFISLALAVATLKKSFNTNLIRFLNIICGVIIIFYGFKLGYSFFKLIA
jgi:L-lysine exporter family protein LysE/ArgO